MARKGSKKARGIRHKMRSVRSCGGQKDEQLPISEQGMWLLFDVPIDDTFDWHNETLNRVHVFYTAPNTMDTVSPATPLKELLKRYQKRELRLVPFMNRGPTTAHNQLIPPYLRDVLFKCLHHKRHHNPVTNAHHRLPATTQKRLEKELHQRATELQRELHTLEQTVKDSTHLNVLEAYFHSLTRVWNVATPVHTVFAHKSKNHHADFKRLLNTYPPQAITYIRTTESTSWMDIVDVLRDAVPFLWSGCVIEHCTTRVTDVARTLFQTWLKLYSLPHKILETHMGLKVVIQSNSNSVYPDVQCTVRKSTNAVKVLNVRKDGQLWHFGHFFPDCLVAEERQLPPNKYKTIRLNIPSQTIGTFNEYYEYFMCKQNVELDEDTFHKCYCTTRCVNGSNMGPYKLGYFNRFSAYSKRFTGTQLTNIPVSPRQSTQPSQQLVLLIGRGLQKLAYTDLRSGVNPGQLTTGSERRTIDQHEQLHAVMKTHFGRRFVHLVIEDIEQPTSPESLWNYSTPQEAPFKKMFDYFHRASIVVAQHGGGLFNIALCRPGTIVVEVAPKLIPVFEHICTAQQLNYIFCENKYSSIKKLVLAL